MMHIKITIFIYAMLCHENDNTAGCSRPCFVRNNSLIARLFRHNGFGALLTNDARGKSLSGGNRLEHFLLRSK